MKKYIKMAEIKIDRAENEKLILEPLKTAGLTICLFDSDDHYDHWIIMREWQ